MTAVSSPVPSFGLYGEAGDWGGPLLHIETIAERSVANNWEIAPHRHPRSIQLLLVFAGEALTEVEGRQARLAAPSWLCIPQGTVHGFRFVPDTTGYVVTLSVDFLSRASEDGDRLLDLLTDGGRGTIPPMLLERTEWLARELLDQTSGWPVDNRLSASLFETLLRSLPGEEPRPPGDPRLAHFRQLIEVHMTEHRPVAFYAQKIGLSPRSLSRLCTQYIGGSPQAVINRRLAAEADRMLRHTNASVVQVSDALGFRDPSYFSRFFQREAGQRPSVVKREADLRP